MKHLTNGRYIQQYPVRFFFPNGTSLHIFKKARKEANAIGHEHEMHKKKTHHQKRPNPIHRRRLMAMQNSRRSAPAPKIAANN